ncbi:hypothetical protein BJ322DRAFT_1016751 [Thelephora terrestris]|uniref:DUF6697 domain-containing protein n=1 Tax=Thelephora terrestris TaxID=56493 RepID=A0A9P6LDI5_9AGAM|nr:hypothetical protein BJ322DRAFT_1016751 [Thelephora terrestris]
MSKSRSNSRQVSEGTITVDARYGQELVEFWTQKYERAQEELNKVRLRDSSVATSSSSSSSPCNEDDEERINESSSVTENEEEFEVEALKACNAELMEELAASAQERQILLEALEALRDQNASLASEAGALRQQKIESIYPPESFLPAGWTSTIFRVPSETLSGRVSADVLGGRPIFFIPRPPACLPLRVGACGKHGYWFSPEVECPESTEFELIVEEPAAQWTYLGRYKRVDLPGGEMRLSEWLELPEQTRVDHCRRVAIQGLGQAPSTQAAVSAAAAEFRRQYESGKATIPCFALVHTALGTTLIRKCEFDEQAGGKRLKRDTDVDFD